MAEFKTPMKKTIEPNENITIPASPFLKRLGYGTGVSVMQLVRSPKAGQIRSPWALKMLNKRVKQHKVYTDRLKIEGELLQRMSHPNIVGFRAFGKKDTLYLGMESCDVSLGDMIEKRGEENGDPFTPRQILKVAADIGSGLDYLHTKMQLLHGDMKSFNILVNGDFAVCKLCDFGVTLPLDENGKFDKEQNKTLVYYGTEAWSAPEVLNGEEITSQTDIWPLGLTLWEMMALCAPHTDIDDDTLDDSVMSFDESEMSFDENKMFEKYGTRPAIPANISEETYVNPLILFHCCTETSPSRRPTAQHLTTAATDMMQQCTQE